MKEEQTVKEIYQEILSSESSGTACVLVTVVEKNGSGPAPVGARMLVKADGSTIGTVGGGTLELIAVKYASQLFSTGKPGLKKYLLSPDNQQVNEDLSDTEKTGMMCGGSTTLFYEKFGSNPRVFIFGAGHIGKALVRLLKDLDYFTTVTDNRPGLTDQLNGAHLCLTVPGNYETALEGMDVPAGSYFIIATHSHALDYVVLKRIYQAGWNPRYIGLIASRKKAPAMIGQLQEDLGKAIDLSCLYSPVGLHIGGSTPAEIAISIVAELQVVRYGKKGHAHMDMSAGKRLEEFGDE